MKPISAVPLARATSDHDPRRSHHEEDSRATAHRQVRSGDRRHPRRKRGSATAASLKGRPNLRRLLLAATLTLVASLAVAGSVSAAPGEGADVFREDYCFSYDENGTFCADAKWVQNETTTPSGNVSYHANGRAEYTFSGAGPFEGCNSSFSDNINYHYLLKDGELHEYGSRSKAESSFDCHGYSEHCTFNVHYHYANGKLQFSRPEVDCTQPDVEKHADE